MFDPLIILNNKNNNTVYKVYSPKLGRMIKLFSDLEYDNWVLLETNPYVVTFCERPIKIRSFIDGKQMVSIFDMWVKNTDNSEYLMKIKYGYESNYDYSKIKKQSHSEIQKAWCRENGFNYVTITEETIRSNILYLDNMKQLIPVIAQYNEIIETDIKSISNLLEGHKRISLSDIYFELSSITKPRIKSAVYWLIYSGKVSSDIKAVSLGYRTQIWKTSKENTNKDSLR